MTIYSRANLSVAKVTKDDSAQPRLGNVLFAPDGTTCGISRSTTALVGPVPSQRLDSVPLKDSKLVREHAVPLRFVKQLSKDVPKDTTFDGLLEHVSIVSDGDDTAINATVKDGRDTRHISGRSDPRGFVPWRKIVRRFFSKKARGVSAKVVVNLKRLRSMLDVINDACADKTGAIPVWIEILQDGGIILRSVHPRTQQRVVGLMTEATDIEWLDVDEWEQSLGEYHVTKKRRSHESVGAEES